MPARVAAMTAVRRTWSGRNLPHLSGVAVTVEAGDSAGAYAVRIDGHVAGQFFVRADGTVELAEPSLAEIFEVACLEGVRSANQARRWLQAEVDAGRARRPVRVRRIRTGSYWTVEIDKQDLEGVSLSPYALDLLREDLDRLVPLDDGWDE